MDMLSDDPSTPASRSPSPLYSSRRGSVGAQCSDGHALALVADELTLRLVKVRRRLTHERKHHSKLSERKRTIDLKEDLLVKAYNEIQELKAKDVSVIGDRVLNRFTHLPQDACSETVDNLEAGLARLCEDLDSLRAEHYRLEEDSQAQIGELVSFVNFRVSNPSSAGLENQRDNLFREKEEKIRQLAETSTMQCGLYISNNNIGWYSLGRFPNVGE
jgi:hypothetical protein